jgi:very-short-patch-repair endonuclease
MSFKPILLLNNWCPKCAGRLNNNINTIQKLAIDRGGKCLSSIYKNNKTNLKWECGKCNHVWLARLDRVKSGTWCPNCNKSHGEKAVQKYLEQNKIEYICEHSLNLRNMRFDFYLPKLNIAIEYDGIQHFQIYGRYTQNKEILLKRQKFDIDKTKHCIENNITLIRIHYTSLNIINKILDKILTFEDKLILTAWDEYKYIINHINTPFLMLLTGVG